MANFQTRFNEAAAEARRLVGEHSSEIEDILTGFSALDFDRATSSISELLERVDKNSVDHPEYLAHSSGNIAEYVVQVIDGVPSSLETGTAHFVQTTLPAIIACEERLLKAVGNYYYQVREVKNRQLREIQKLAEESLEFREEARKARDETVEIQAKAEKGLSHVSDAQQDVKLTLDKVSEIRELVTKLASGDGRGKSLESFRRVAESKIDAIELVLRKADAAMVKVDASSKALTSASESAEATRDEIDAIKSEASAVLGLSHQAGLARSYLQESSKLALKSYIYTGILYATSIATALIAALYVLPSLEQSLSATGESLTERAIPVALLRATVLAPLVYVLYFTTRQISALETLRMDYAEKAAASLAYSGYKDEMSEDTTLLDRLRGSLLLKFAEHPERLLRKRPVRDTIEVQTPGFKATSSSADVAATEDPAK